MSGFAGWPGRDKSRPVDALLATHENNFGVMRLCLAALVLFSHGFPLTGRHDEWFATLTGHTTGGGIAVAGFFVISGFLVTGSLGERDWRRYANHRILRLVPAMAVMSFLCAFQIGRAHF